MASVTSLDKDLRNMRLSKYTPQAANEVRDWIEEVLGERLPGGDLLEALKDGVALCKLVNLAVPSPGIKYKASPMPFVQMENISHFLRACQLPPLNLPPHDVFLTVDLYEAKDPAQVLQCLGSFSRKANSLQPGRFRRSIGPKGKTNSMSPTQTGASDKGRSRGFSNASETRSPALAGMSPALTGSSNSSKPSGNGVPPSPRAGVSSWSRKTDEVNTSPAWNIHQYGYMGGASQGNQGISFGARRQITTASPTVPSMADKEKRRREEEAEKEVLKTQAEEAEYKRRVEREAEEERDRIAEEQRWEEETRTRREKELLDAQEESRRWGEEEKKWKADEERRIQEETEAELRAERDRQAKRIISDNRLRGQFLSQYQAEQQARLPKHEHSAESERIRELERELEEARQRERQYEQERQKNLSRQPDASSSPSAPLSTPAPPASASKPTSTDDDSAWQEDERDYLRREWGRQNTASPSSTPSAFSKPPPQPPRPLPDAPIKSTPTAAPTAPPTSTRPLPDPKKTYTPYRPPATATAALNTTPNTTIPKRTTSSLLEREMERERERQREWEAAQAETRAAAANNPNASAAGFGPRGETWDVHQYGWLGGDSQNRGDQGIGIGQGRRQILGPRPQGS